MRSLYSHGLRIQPRICAAPFCRSPHASAPPRAGPASLRSCGDGFHPGALRLKLKQGSPPPLKAQALRRLCPQGAASVPLRDHAARRGKSRCGGFKTGRLSLGFRAPPPAAADEPRSCLRRLRRSLIFRQDLPVPEVCATQSGHGESLRRAAVSCRARLALLSSLPKTARSVHLRGRRGCKSTSGQPKAPHGVRRWQQSPGQRGASRAR